ncbi:hypothetical protein D3C76_1456090 [compost metagenome]
MTAQLNAVRDAKHDAKARRVANYGWKHQSHSIKVNSQLVIQHVASPLNIINIKRTDAARPQDNAEVVSGLLFPECGSLR